MLIYILEKGEESVLKIKELTCGYNENNVIHEIDFEVEKGENITIIGPNGCGKSTILKALGGIIDYKGSITIENKELKNIKRRERAKKIALMSQSSEIFFEYSVYETVALGRYAYTKDMFSSYTKEDSEIIEEALKSVNISNLKEKSIRELSGGQLQRVYLARAFVQEPDVILLDEPTNHLDLKCQIEILSYINNWVKEKNKIVIAVLHDLNLVGSFSERTILIDEGKIIKIGNTKDILNSEELKKVYKVDIKKFMRNSLKLWE